MQEDDYIVPFYRDRALVLGLGAGRGSWPSIISRRPRAKVTGDNGRRIYSSAEKPHLECGDPNGFNNCCGVRDSVGNQTGRKKKALWSNFWRCATRQAIFTKLICFAKEKKLPILLSSRTTVTASASDPQNQSARA